MSEADLMTPKAGPVVSEVGRKYLRLHLAPMVGPIRLRNLIEHFGSIEAVLDASRTELMQVSLISEKVAEAVFQARGDATVDTEIERASQCGVRILCLEDSDYPKPLHHIPDPPTCIYVRGTLQPTDCVALAIVGTRRCSHYGREQAMRFAELLGAAGFTVISGLARGVDGHAHRGAIRAGGRTIAVLGNGLATVYPPEHNELAEEITRAGALVSEYPIDVSPTPENFPRRNRIIVGLALGVIIVEAGKRSGALITARLAGEYNREVFAIPGRLDQPSLTCGTNGLIRDGQAKLITSLEDILDELQEVGEIMRGYAGDEAEPAGEAPAAASPAGATEQAILTVLAEGTADADEICMSAELDMAQVTSTLTALQLKGLIQRLPGNRFARRKARAES